MVYQTRLVDIGFLLVCGTLLITVRINQRKIKKLREDIEELKKK